MNFMRNNCGSTSGRRQQQTGGGGGGGGGYSYEEDDEEEKEQMPASGQLFPSSTSSSPSSSSLHPPPPYHHHQRHHHGGGGWLHNTSQGGESCSSRLDPMMLDSASARPATEDAHPQPLQHGQDEGEPSHQAAGMMMVEREHMFDKVVTPSDVGKLNRLVIPKQHAERYFPLDSSTNDKGLLLNFEDRNGKPWRFRYSYWNSSQSYVMTKGWSRFVKEKKLDAGDIVSFQRGVGGSAKDRLFIDWRRRPDAPTPSHLSNLSSFPHHQLSFHTRNSINIHPWNPLFLQSQPAQPRGRSSLMIQPLSNSPNSFASYTYGSSVGPYNISTGSVVNVNQGSVIYFRSGGSSSSSGGGGGGPPQQQQQQVEMMQLQQQRSGVGMDPPPITAPPSAAVVFESVPVVHGKAAAKRLRLFGVNMDCPISEDAQDYDPSELSPSNTANSHHENFPLSSSISSSTIPYQQLRPYYGGTPSHQTTAMSSGDALNKNKSTSSNMSLDFDM